MGRALRILTGGWQGTAMQVNTRGYFTKPVILTVVTAIVEIVGMVDAMVQANLTLAANVEADTTLTGEVEA